jgi:Protein of unknown function (DUF2946)
MIRKSAKRFSGSCPNKVPHAMRRRFQKFLPIILIALMVQILAPVGATWAAAIAAGDPLNAAPICHGGQEGLPSHNDQNGRAHDGACSVCCAAQAGATLDTPEAASVPIPYRMAARVIWRDEASVSMPVRPGSNAQARAPPQAS